jgi:hypothetical protein
MYFTFQIPRRGGRKLERRSWKGMSEPGNCYRAADTGVLLRASDFRPDCEEFLKTGKRPALAGGIDYADRNFDLNFGEVDMLTCC